MRLKNYLNENKNIEKAKKELAFLKKSEKMGKLKAAGKKKKERLEDYLYSKDVFDF